MIKLSQSRNSVHNNSNDHVLENKLKGKEEVFILNPPKPYLGGTQPHKVFVNIKQFSYEEKQNLHSQERPSVMILNPTTITFNNINIDPKKKKIVQKEKSYSFDLVQGEEVNNQMFHKKAISQIVQKFCAGINQSILVIGGEGSGKTQTLVGGMRDPGLFILSLEEIFEILYQSPDRENTTLKMSMYYNDDTYFYDLLVNSQFPHKLYEKENGEVFPLGISEVIVTSLRTSLKILKIGLDNIENSEEIKKQGNIVINFKCEKSENILVSQDTIYSTFKIIKISDGAYQEIFNNSKNECMVSNLMNCLRQLSKMSNKKKNAIIPFRKHIFTEYLRESLIGNSQTSIICCLSNTQKRVNDTSNVLRLGNACKKIYTNPKETKYSLSQQQNIYNDILENIGNTISIWLKEFWGEIEKSKHKRLKIIFKILRNLEKYLYSLLDGLEQQIQIDLIKNALFSKILDMHCKVYSESITSEDIKEFFIAKIQVYAKKQLNDQFEQIYPSIHFVLNQLEEGKEKIIKNKNKLFTFFRHYSEVKKVAQTGNLKDIQNLLPSDIKLTQLLLTNVQSLTNLDIEKMGFLQKLFTKFQEICENLIEINQYIPQNVRLDIQNCLKDYKFLEKTLIDEGVYQLEESNINSSRISHRFNNSLFKQNQKARNSTFKLQHDVFSRSRVNSQQSERSISRQNSQFDHGILQKLDKQTSQCYNDTQSEVSKEDEADLENSQSDYYLNDKSKITQLNNSQLEKSNIADKQKLSQEKLDARKIRDLQIKLKIIPREKDIFVNNTKLSFKRQSDPNTLNLFTKNQNYRQNTQFTQSYQNENTNEYYKGLLSNKQSYAFQSNKKSLKTDSMHTSSVQDAIKQQQLSKQDTIMLQDYDNDNKLIEKIFTCNMKYSSMYQTNKYNGNIFLTQISRDNKTSNSSSQILDKNVYSHKQSITSLNFNPSDIPSMRKYPQMLNTVYSYKLPTLSESISKESIKKFMNH
ncbi:hypothetical protein ABPG74_005362 [Tetrahymena malaccensis]